MYDEGKTLTVGTVRNITTSCSWLKTGCLTRALTNLTRPRLRFSMNVTSADRCLPLTESSQFSVLIDVSGH